MYLYPLIRINRALAATLIYSEHPVEAIAISEVISVVGPFFNPMIYRNLIGTIYAIIYMPQFTEQIIKIQTKPNTLYNKAEICCLLLFIIYYGLPRII